MGQRKTYRVNFDAWAPDAAVLDGKQTVTAENVLPTSRGYRPMREPLPILPELPEDVLGSVCFMDGAERLHHIAATESHIYAWETDEWVEKYEGANAYSSRRFAVYGNDVYCCFGDKVVYSVGAGSTIAEFSELEDAPSARGVSVIKDFLCLDQLTGEGGANKIHWSGIDDPTAWPEPGSSEAVEKQSDTQVFPIGGSVRAVVGGVNGIDGIVFMDNAVFRMEYVNTPYIFQFQSIDNNTGLAAKDSAIACDDVCVFFAWEGWYATDGSNVKSLGGERIDRWFFDEADLGRIEEIQGAWDTINRVCMWRFASKDCPEGKTDRLLIWNHDLDRFSYAKIDCELVSEDFSPGVTLEGLDLLYPDMGMDLMPVYDMDDVGLRGGAPGISCFIGGRLSRFTGENLEAKLESAEFGGERMMIHGVRPLADTGAAKALILTRGRQSEARALSVQMEQSRDGICYFHKSCSYVTSRVIIPAKETWVSITGCDIIYEEE